MSDVPGSAPGRAIFVAAMLALGACQGSSRPYALDEAFTTREDVTISRLVHAGSDAPIVAYNLVSPPRHGEVTLDPTAGKFTYRPFADYHGPDQFAFPVSDGLYMSETATISLTVVPVNDAPGAQDQAVTLDEDSAYAGQVVATDVDRNMLTFAVTAWPEHGSLIFDPVSGGFLYQPLPDYNGPDQFRFTASDGALDSNEAAVSITVTPVNDVPVVQDQAVRIDEDTPLAGRVVGSDVDGDALTYSVLTEPAHGTVTLDAVNGILPTGRRRTSTEQTPSRSPSPTGSLLRWPPSRLSSARSMTRPPCPPSPIRPTLPRHARPSSPCRCATWTATSIQYTVSVSDPAVAAAVVDSTGTLVVTPLGRGAADGLPAGERWRPSGRRFVPLHRHRGRQVAPVRRRGSPRAGHQHHQHVGPGRGVQLATTVTVSPPPGSSWSRRCGTCPTTCRESRSSGSSGGTCGMAATTSIR